MERERYEKTYGLRTAETCSSCLHGEYENDDIYSCHMMKPNGIDEVEVRSYQVCNLYESSGRLQKNNRRQ